LHIDVECEANMTPGKLLALLVTGIAAVASTAAYAHGGGRGRVGIYVAPPPIRWAPPPPRYYAPRVIVPGAYGYGYVAPVFPAPVYPGPIYAPGAVYAPGPIYGPYPPAVYGTPTPPPVYIERAPSPQQPVVPAPAASAEGSFWYYCPNPEGYHPQVSECPDGWVRVAPPPQAPAQAPAQAPSAQ